MLLLAFSSYNSFTEEEPSCTNGQNGMGVCNGNIVIMNVGNIRMHFSKATFTLSIKLKWNDWTWKYCIMCLQWPHNRNYKYREECVTHRVCGLKKNSTSSIIFGNRRQTMPLKCVIGCANVKWELFSEIICWEVNDLQCVNVHIIIFNWM